MKRIFIYLPLLLCSGILGCSQSNQSKEKVKPAIEIKAHEFDLSDVKVKEGPFKSAMKTNEEYLLFLEPDRFLAWFREEAGLKAKGDVYGGWESEGYVIAGHTLGHYLSALSKQYRSAGDERIKEKLDYTIEELSLIQQENGDGYLSAIKDREAFKEIAEGNIRPDGFSLNDVNVPWYNLDKTFQGLTDAYLLGDNDKALTLVENLTNWADSITANLTEEQWAEMLSVEFGGMNHSLANVYAITGNPKHLELAEKFYHHDVLDPLAEGRDELAGLHANTQVPKIRGVAKVHELTNKPKYHSIADFFWHQVVDAHTYVNGGHGHEEYFGQPYELAERLNHTTETCNTHNMLWLTRMLFSWEPDGKLMDYFERGLYNHILASQNPETGMFVYKGYLDMPARKGFSDPTHSFWCCVGSGMENHTNYGEGTYFHTGDSLYVNLFMASELNWEEKGLKLEQKTNFPLEESTQLGFSAEKPVDLSLLVRDPQWWGKDMQILVNGDPFSLSGPDKGYYEIRRTFSEGDVIEVNMSMEPRIEAMPDDKDRIAFFHGPVLLNAILDWNTEGDARKEDVRVPQLDANRQELLNALQPVEGEELHYKAEGVGRIQNEGAGTWESVDIYLKPHYKTVNEIYTVYMDIRDRK